MLYLCGRVPGESMVVPGFVAEFAELADTRLLAIQGNISASLSAREKGFCKAYPSDPDILFNYLLSNAVKCNRDCDHQIC